MMMRHTRSTVGLATLAYAMLPGVSHASDWPNFRGPNHDGISAETGLVTTWNKPLTLLWNRDVGSAFASFACVGDRVFTCGMEEGQQTLLCLNADTGDVVWRNRFEKKYLDSMGGDGTRATPTVDGNRVYIVGGHGTLLCADAKTGKEIWTTQLGKPPQWGHSGSVLIEGNLAIVVRGSHEGAALAINNVLLALDKKSGAQVWSSGAGPVGYATPYPFTFNRKRYIAGFVGNAAIIVRADTGEEVWRMEWKTSYEVNAAAPIYHDGHLLFSSGYRHGAILLKLAEAAGKLSAETIWEGKAVRNKFQSCILHEGHLYTSDEQALKCVEFLTGTEKWSVRRAKHGTLVLAEGNLFFLNQEGELQIGPVSTEGFSPTTTASILGGRCWTVPVLHAGRIYARNLNRVVCFKLTE